MVSDLSDTDLAMAARGHVASGRTNLLVIANKYTARVLASAPATPDQWVEVGHGDLADETAEVLGAAGKQSRLLWLETVEDDVALTAVHAGTAVKVGVAHVRSWQRARDSVTGTGGRQGEVDAKVRFEVASLAGWRCQFDGCGEDLRRHFVPGASGNYGYFAHIVASSKDGPRGKEGDCAKLANDPSNIMLMCDKCHRLIDRIAPARYKAAPLREMRENSIVEVRRLLDSLRYPGAQMLVVGGNIEGQSFAFDERVAEEAMWLRQFRSATPRAEWFARNGPHLGASNSNGYWLSLFELLKSDIPRLKGLLTGTLFGGAPRPPLALFPLHGTSVLVLTGRLIGESSTVRQFQFQRDEVAGRRGGQWAWPGLPAPATDKYKVAVLKPAGPGDSEGLLRINLTDGPPPADLPAHLYADGQYSLPTVEVTAETRGPRVIGHPEDLVLLGRALDSALRTLQENWRLRTIHVVAIAPATACVRTGQKLQARHHADVVLYERKPSATPGTRGPFEPTIRISSTEVTLLSTGESTSIS